MAAAFKMPQEPCPLPSLDSDEESFVVLGQSIPDDSTEVYSEPMGLSVIAEAKRLINSELEAIQQTKIKTEDKKSLDTSKENLDQSLSKMVTSNLPTLPKLNKGVESLNTISITSFTPDMTSEEIQNKLSQLIDENIHLKDTILQNNMSLKSQYERIVAWQEDVQKIHKTHKDKLLEAKSFIENLKIEKENLKYELEKSKQLVSELTKKNKELERSLKDKSNVANEVLEKRSDDNMKSFQLDVANKKIKDLETAVGKLVEENTSLLSQITQPEIQDENTQLITDLKLHLTDTTLENQRMHQIHTRLNSKLKEDEGKLKGLKSALEKITEERDSLLDEVQDLKEKLASKMLQEESLLTAANQLKARLDEQYAQIEAVSHLRTQLIETQTALTQMEHTRTQAYAQVGKLTDELSAVKLQLEKLKMEKEDEPEKSDKSQDEIFALKTQLDVYKADFNEERRARELIKSENDRLQEDLENVQRRNQQLQEEIEIIRKETDYVVYSSSSSAKSGEASPYTKTKVKCPKCNFGFANVGELEKHVNRCLDLDDNLP